MENALEGQTSLSSVPTDMQPFSKERTGPARLLLASGPLLLGPFLPFPQEFTDHWPRAGPGMRAQR